jgi:hypothetical protein
MSKENTENMICEFCQDDIIEDNDEYQDDNPRWKVYWKKVWVDQYEQEFSILCTGHLYDVLGDRWLGTGHFSGLIRNIENLDKESPFIDNDKNQ